MYPGLRAFIRVVLLLIFGYTSPSSIHSEESRKLLMWKTKTDDHAYQLGWAYIAGERHVLQSSTDLVNWTPVQSWPSYSQDGVFGTRVNDEDIRKFYRVHIQTGDTSIEVRDGLVAEYRFESNSGTTAIDTSDSQLDGELMNGAQWTDGYTGMGLHFDGIDDYVLIGDHDEIEVEHFTLTAWTRSNGNTVDELRQEILEKADSYWLNIRNESHLVRTGGFYGDCSVRQEWFYTDSSIPYEFNQWTHLTSSYDGQYLRIYINGQLVSKRLVDRPLCNDRDKLLVLGAKKEYLDTPTVAQFSGTLDEIRIYNRALSHQEIVDVMHATP